MEKSLSYLALREISNRVGATAPEARLTHWLTKRGTSEAKAIADFIARRPTPYISNRRTALALLRNYFRRNDIDWTSIDRHFRTRDDLIHRGLGPNEDRCEGAKQVLQNLLPELEASDPFSTHNIMRSVDALEKLLD